MVDHLVYVYSYTNVPAHGQFDCRPPIAKKRGIVFYCFFFFHPIYGRDDENTYISSCARCCVPQAVSTIFHERHTSEKRPNFSVTVAVVVVVVQQPLAVIAVIIFRFHIYTQYNWKFRFFFFKFKCLCTHSLTRILNYYVSDIIPLWYICRDRKPERGKENTSL